MKSYKYIFTFILLYIICSFSTVFAEGDIKNIVVHKNSNDNIQIIVEGTLVSSDDASPFVDTSSRTQCPIRAFSNAIDADIQWNEKTDTATMYYNSKTITIKKGSTNLIVDGIYKKMDTVPVLMNDRLYVPVRYIGEAFGFTVEWTENKNISFVNRKPTYLDYEDISIARAMYIDSNMIDGEMYYSSCFFTPTIECILKLDMSTVTTNQPLKFKIKVCSMDSDDELYVYDVESNQSGEVDFNASIQCDEPFYIKIDGLSNPYASINGNAMVVLL